MNSLGLLIATVFLAAGYFIGWWDRDRRARRETDRIHYRTEQRMARHEKRVTTRVTALLDATLGYHRPDPIPAPDFATRGGVT